MFRFSSRILFLLSSVAALCFSPIQANAQMVLTSTAIAEGFKLSVFATGFPNTNGEGPLGIAVSGGKVVVSDYLGNVRVFPTDTDGQTAASAPVGYNYGGRKADGLAVAGGNFYLAQQLNNAVIQINPDGTPRQTIATGVSGATGIVADPANGHLFVGAIYANQILDVNPLTKTSTVFKNVTADGLTTDGVTLYAALSNHILGYRISDGVQVFDSGIITGGPDGAALGNGILAGDLFVNTNDGHLLEYNLSGTPIQTVIAQGGSRGDFVTADPNGTLLLTQTDRILRLTAPAGGGFGNTPEPGTITMLLAGGLTGAGWLLRRRQRMCQCI